MVEQLTEAAMLMMVGMVVVFTFLSLLMGGIHAIALFVRKFPAPSTETVISSAEPMQNDGNQRISSGKVAAITAAIHLHRNRQK
ncbi:MAG: OadG family protein [Pseudomonadota bacterium]